MDAPVDWRGARGRPAAFGDLGRRRTAYFAVKRLVCCTAFRRTQSHATPATPLASLTERRRSGAWSPVRLSPRSHAPDHGRQRPGEASGHQPRARPALRDAARGMTPRNPLRPGRAREAKIDAAPCSSAAPPGRLLSRGVVPGAMRRPCQRKTGFCPMPKTRRDPGLECPEPWLQRFGGMTRAARFSFQGPSILRNSRRAGLISVSVANKPVD
jgi:hypothetical protein